jgi:hypothetical protein
LGAAAALVLLVGGAVAFASQSVDRGGSAVASVGAPPPPPLTLLPPQQAVTRHDTIDLTAVAPTGLRHDQSYEVRVFINDQPVRRTSLGDADRLTLDDVPLVEGTNSVTATLVGAGGESAPSAAVAITRDDVAPDIEISQPTERVYTETATLLGTTEAGADLEITDSAGREVDSSVQANGRFSAALELHVGNNQLTLRSTDAAGNKSTKSITVVRGSSSASIELTATPSDLYRADLPEKVDLTVVVRDELGRPVADGTTVTFGVSPPASATMTYTASTTNGRARFDGLRIESTDAIGQWIVTVLVSLPSGIELRDDASFSLHEGAPKSPAQR